MKFSKIKLSKSGTLECTFKNEDGDIVQFVGANIVHKDLREALQGLIPHLALITEQREAYKTTLDKLREQRITDTFVAASRLAHAPLPSAMPTSMSTALSRPL